MSIKDSYPYFDDFNASKGFHQILFHPAKPVQARELSQIQSILQNQIKQHGDHMFKNGTIVIPGHTFYDKDAKYLKLETVYNQVNVESYLTELVGKEIKGDTNAITAIVIHADTKTATDPTTLYIKYTSASGSIKEFVSGETMTCPEIAGLVFKISPVTDYTGSAAICTINEGVYYVNGYFVQVLKQSATVSKYNNTSSAVVGLDYIESVVTENDDESLFDNANGFTNFGAPGAHRLKIELKLSVKTYEYDISETSEIKFIDILKVKNGNIEYLKNDTKYAEIERWLAARTYEESGNYAVTPFSFAAADYRNNDRGQWATNTPYLAGDVITNGNRFYIALNKGYSGATAPTHKYGIASDGIVYWNEIVDKTAYINEGKVNMTSTDINAHATSENDMVVELSPAKVYVKGYGLDFDTPTTSIVPKARKTKQLTRTQLYAPTGSYVIVNNMVGIPNVTTNLVKVDIKDLSATTIGTAWVRSIEYHTGTPNSTTAEYRVFLFDIKMNAGYNFAKHANSIANGAVFVATIKPTYIPLSGSLNSVTASTAITGTGTYFDFELSIGDRVYIPNASLPTSKIISVASAITPTSFTANTNTTTAVGSSIYRCESTLVKLGNYVQKLSNESIKSLRDSNGVLDMEYVVYKNYSFTSSGTGTASFTLTGGESFLPSEHIVALANSPYTIANPSYSLDSPATTLTISGLANSTNYNAVLIVKRTQAFAKEKSKNLAVATMVLNNTGTQKYNALNIALTQADCTRLIKVTESGDPTDKVNYVEAGETDITSYYKFETGQKPEYYDLGRIKTSRAASRPIRITFEYYVHSTGDYFSVDSYSSIPRNMLGDTIIDGQAYFLPDCLDFRSKISTNGLTFDSAGGASVSDPLSSEHTMTTSYSYYLPRTDELGIGDDGKLYYMVDSKLKDGMKVCTINVPSFTYKANKEVTFADEQVVNYTMEDIKKLDSRLEDVEYYVALSQLEKDTVNVSIKDQFGLEVDKNGFLIDSFKDRNASDIYNIDYRAAIDLDKQECRALSSIDKVHLIEPVGVTASSRLANGYQLTNSMITLPYVEEAMIAQKIASKAETVQAYASLDFTGLLTIYPHADSYTDNQTSTSITTTTAEPITNVVETTSQVYGWWWGGYHCWYNWCNNFKKEVVTTTSVENKTRVTSDYWTSNKFAAPMMRARTVVTTAKKIKPFTALNTFFSGAKINHLVEACSVVNITTSSTFIGAESDVANDNLTKRMTNNYYRPTWNNWTWTVPNTYDVIQHGDVISCTTGSAVVVADETIYDKVSGTNKRVLYVTNIKGTLSGEITGSLSNAVGTVVSVTAGVKESNSLGHYHAVIKFPALTFKSGSNSILITDADNADPNAATSMADAKYSSNGVINAHVRHINYETQSVTTVVNETKYSYVPSYGWND